MEHDKNNGHDVDLFPDKEPSPDEKPQRSMIPLVRLPEGVNWSEKGFIKLTQILAATDVKRREIAMRLELERLRLESKHTDLKSQHAAPKDTDSAEGANPAEHTSSTFPPRIDTNHPSFIKRLSDAIDRLPILRIAAGVSAVCAAIMALAYYEAETHLKKDEAYDELHNRLDIARWRYSQFDPDTQVEIDKSVALEVAIRDQLEELFKGQNVFTSDGLIAWEENEGRRLVAYCTDCCSRSSHAVCGSLLGFNIQGSLTQDDGMVQPPSVSVSYDNMLGGSNIGRFNSTDVGGDGLADEGYLLQVADNGSIQTFSLAEDGSSIQSILNGGLDEMHRKVLDELERQGQSI